MKRKHVGYISVASFYRLDGLLVIQPIASENWRETNPFNPIDQFNVIYGSVCI